MKKVVYSIRKVRNSEEKLSGLGFINDEGTLFCKCISKNGKQYTRAFDDVEQHCFPVFGKENEYKGYVTMYYEYEGRDIEVEYSVWYCSLLLAQNVPIQTVSKYMGHSDSTITLQVYSHFIPDTKERVVNALNNLMDD